MVKPTHGSRKRVPPVGIEARLEEAEATLRAIRSGEVDAVVVSGPEGERTVAFGPGAQPYHVLLNAMSDGAALLAPVGTVLFANRGLGAIVRVATDRLRGTSLTGHIASVDRSRFTEFLRSGAEHGSAGEFDVITEGDVATPVWIAISAVSSSILMVIVTDLTARKHAEAVRLGLMRNLIAAEDQERRRIARELHDETGQSLTALLVGLRGLEEDAITQKVRTAAQRLREIAADTVDNVGRLARGLHPSVLDDLGLSAAVQRYVRDYSRSFGITVDLQSAPLSALVLAPLVQTTMYRILQETLTNVARHARATSVQVAFTMDGPVLALRVVDDGVGFNPEAAFGSTTSLGLLSMRERVALMAGTLVIESVPDGGTTVCVRIPTEAGPRAD